jgi:hypothetical protein
MDLYSGNKILWERTGFFSEKVNELADNPTGQAMCFEHVKDFNNQLNLISTDNLIKELLRRNDNPFAGIDLDGFKNDKVYLSQYVVGITNYTDTEYGQTESFETYYTCENIESARKYCAKLGGRNKIMKRVYLNIDEQDV